MQMFLKLDLKMLTSSLAGLELGLGALSF